MDLVTFGNNPKQACQDDAQPRDKHRTIQVLPGIVCPANCGALDRDQCLHAGPKQRVLMNAVSMLELLLISQGARSSPVFPSGLHSFAHGDPAFFGRVLYFNSGSSPTTSSTLQSRLVT